MSWPGPLSLLPTHKLRVVLDITVANALEVVSIILVVVGVVKCLVDRLAARLRKRLGLAGECKNSKDTTIVIMMLVLINGYRSDDDD